MANTRMRRRKAWVWALALAAMTSPASPGVARAEKEPSPDPEAVKRALVVAMDQVPYERALDHELVVEYETHGVRTDVEVFLRREGKWIGRPLRVRVEADGKVKVRQHGWAGRALSRDPIQPSQRAGRAGFRALVLYLDLDGDFQLTFLTYPRNPQVEDLVIALAPSPYRLYHGPPLMIKARPDGSTRQITTTPLWLLRSLAPVGI